MRILYVCSDLGIPVLGSRGGSIHVRSLIDAFTRARHSVILASPVLTKSSWETPARIDVPVIHLPPSALTDSAPRSVDAFAATVGAVSPLADELRRILYNGDLADALRRRFRDAPPDIVYERCASYGIAGAVVADALGVPLFLEVNAPLLLEAQLYRRGQGVGELAAASERWTISRAAAVLVVSAPLREHIVSLGVVPERVHIVPNGIDGAVFRPGPRAPAVRARWGLDGEPIVGFVGGYQPWHGIDTLPALIEHLLPRHPAVRLMVVGDGRGRRQFEDQIEARGLSAHVRVTGAVPHEEVPALIREFDVAVAPYPLPAHDFYFSPLKLFEYMGCAAAIAAPRLGQIEEVIRHGETGLLYSPSDPDALADACDRLLSDRELARRLGLAAAAEVHDKYTWDQNAARITRIAETLVEKRLVAP
jgi:glycosyltransferase involved in cell wall biosynthesis